MRFPRSGIDRDRKIRPGGGVDDCISWVAARSQICSDGAKFLRNVRAGNVRIMSRDRRSQQHGLAGVASGRLVLGTLVLGTLMSGTPALAADIALKAPAYRAVYDWTGSIGAHTGYSRGSSVATLTDPATSTAGNLFSGVIGGVQAGYNVRLPSGMLLGVEADVTFPNFLRRIRWCPRLRVRAPTSASNGIMSAPRAAASATPTDIGWPMPPVVWPGPASASSTRPSSATKKSTSTSGSAGPPAPAIQVRLRPTLERQARISLQPVRPGRRSLPLGHAIRVYPGFSIAPHRPQP